MCQFQDFLSSSCINVGYDENCDVGISCNNLFYFYDLVDVVWPAVHDF